MQSGQKIQELRQNAHLTQEQLAEMVFVSRELVSKWELEQRKPDIRTLRRLTQIFSIDITDLLDTRIFLDELAGCIPNGIHLSAEQFENLLQKFLDKISDRDRCVFIRRYYYLDNTSEISQMYAIKENYVRNILARTRKKFYSYIKKYSDMM